MRKIFILITIICFSFLLNAQKISFIYNIKTPDIQQVGDYQLLSFGNSYQIANLGSPSIPFLAVKLVLPDGFIASSIDYKFENKKTLNGKFNLFPFQNVRPLNYLGQDDFIINNAVYNSNLVSNYVSSDVSNQYMNGYAFALANYTPVRYIPSSGEVSYYSKITVTIKLQKDNSSKSIKQNKDSRIIKKVSEFADNYQALKKVDQKPFDADDYEMLIITGDTYANSFDELINNHLKRGIRSKVITLSEISASETGVDVPEKMRNFIIKEYQNHGILYVLLGGDGDVVPIRSLYCEALSGGDTYNDNIPADLYFSALDGNWNNDGDTRYGEPGEDDLLPEIAVGRLTFSNPTELANIIHKIISYSYSPVTSTNELNNPLFAGEKLLDKPLTWGADYLELLIGNHSENGYTTSGILSTQKVSKMYYRNGLNWNKQSIIDSLNNGHSFLYHVGHANDQNMMFLNTSDITSAKFSKLDGIQHNYALVYSHGCVCGAFDYEDCVSETMLKIDKFAVGVFTNSRYGWFNEGTNDGPSEHLNREFVDALYNDKENNAGFAEMISKIQTAPFIGLSNEYEPGAQRWVFYDHNALTDPSLPIWTTKPLEITVVANSILNFGAELPVNVSSLYSSVEDLNCVLVQNNKIFGKAYTNSNGQTIIEPVYDNISVGEAKLYVSGYNILPHEYTLNIVASDTALLNIKNIEYSDGNDNIPQNNESYGLNFDVVNYGNQDASNVVLTLSSDYSLVKITNNQYSQGLVSANSTVSLSNVFLAIDSCVQDQQEVELNLNIASDNYSFNKQIKFKVSTAKVENSSVVFTEVSGDGDEYAEAGETWNVKYGFVNKGHSVSLSTTANSSSNDLSFTNSEFIIDPIDIDAEIFVDYNFELNQNLLNGSKVVLKNIFNSCFFPDSLDVEFYVGNILEDFETGDFSKFDWLNNGSSTWKIDNNVHYQGNFSARSGLITNNQVSTLKINVNLWQQGDISFAKKVSSQLNSDLLMFFIDGISQDIWSGNSDWSVVSYNLAVGNHQLEWEYVKDNSSFSGSDCAWLDNIVFPSFSQIILNIQDFKTDNNFVVYPNPFTQNVYFKINTANTNLCAISVFDFLGKEIYYSQEKLIEGDNLIEWKPQTNLTKGVYFFKILVDNKIISGKIIRN